MATVARSCSNAVATAARALATVMPCTDTPLMVTFAAIVSSSETLGDAVVEGSLAGETQVLPLPQLTAMPMMTATIKASTANSNRNIVKRPQRFFFFLRRFCGGRDEPLVPLA